MLARMWRKGNPLILLVGMQSHAATVENIMEVPQKVKNRTSLQPSNCTTRFEGAHAPLMFTAASLTIVKLWKEPKCPSTDESIKKWHRGTGMAQSVEHPALGFGSRHELVALEIQAHVWLHAQWGVCLKILSLCPSPNSLSNQSIFKKKEVIYI